MFSSDKPEQKKASISKIRPLEKPHAQVRKPQVKNQNRDVETSKNEERHILQKENIKLKPGAIAIHKQNTQKQLTKNKKEGWIKT